MCLTKTHRLPKISRKPIQVYKVFYYFIDNNLLTPYQYIPCNVGKTIKAKNSWLKCIFKNKIRGEGVHAYTKYVVAFKMAELYIDHFVHLCEIPPFTPYWIGIDGDVAASKMIIKKKVKV